MKFVPENLIADFFKRGGRVVTAKKSIPVSGNEVLEYLSSCGVVAKYSPGNARAYRCEGKRFSLQGLVGLANTYRVADHLPPFVPRIEVRGSRFDNRSP